MRRDTIYEDEIHLPIKILNTVFQDESMYDVVRLILQDITESLIKYIFYFYQDPKIGKHDLEKL